MEHRWLVQHRFLVADPGPTVFIHDFVKIDLPFDAVVGAFSYFVSPELIAQLVNEAWRGEMVEVGRHYQLQEAEPEEPPPPLDVELGQTRPRRDALVVPIAWRPASESWLPPLEADLEIVSFGPNRTHLHVLGCSSLPPGTVVSTERSSLDHRLAVALVRHVLADLASCLSNIEQKEHAS